MLITEEKFKEVFHRARAHDEISVQFVDGASLDFEKREVIRITSEVVDLENDVSFEYKELMDVSLVGD